MRTRTPLQAEKILEAAAQLFGSHRFHEVRMEDIAGQADVGKGTLYRYFSDKEELYIAMLERTSMQFVQRIEEAVRGPQRPRKRLEVMVAAVIDYFDTHPHMLDLLQRAEVTRASGTDFPWQRVREQFPLLLQELFDEGKACGDFSIRDPDIAMSLLFGGMRYIIRFGELPRPHDLPQRVVHLLLHGAQE